MKQSKLLVASFTLFATLALYACAPLGMGGPKGGPGGMRVSAHELFTSADVNGDNVLSKQEFINSLPE